MKEEQPKPKGGFREGAGRKKMGGIGTTPINVRIRKDWLELIEKNYVNRSQFINEAVRLKLRKEGLL